MKNPYIKAFTDGFVGSFILAAVILLAIPRAISEFINHSPRQEQNQ